MSALPGVALAQANTTPTRVADGGPPLSSQLSGTGLDHYRAGHIAFEDGDPSGALLKFTAAYDASGNPRLLWNIAACHKELRAYAQVLEFVRRYKTEMGAALSKRRRARADALIEAVEAYVGKLHVDVSEADALIAVDGEVRGRSPLSAPLLVTHGERDLTVSKPGFEDFNRRVFIEGRQALQLSVTLELVKHEGVLVVEASEGEAIRIDGEAVGIGHFRGILPSGRHIVTVSADGKEAQRTPVLIEDDETNTLRIRLTDRVEPTHRKRSPWVWVGTGLAVAAAAAGVTTYLLVREEPTADPIVGGLEPGLVRVRWD